jgi:hypothetical protein
VISKYFLKRGRVVLLLLFAITFVFFQFVSGDTPTELNIPNSPPRLVMNISNQSWEENESNLNAFDLDDYFEDLEGNPLTYYNSSVNEVYVSIDPTSHEVSFFPRAGFRGISNVTFYASDGIYDSLSNVVFLLVGMDLSAPKWDSPSQSNITIYQNTIVDFSTHWTDDRQLERYIFSINQGAGWENYSSVNFSGMDNLSNYTLQIRAPALNTVYWRIYAFDSSDNMNVTSVQSFVVSAQTIPPQEGGDGGGETSFLEGVFKGVDILKQRRLEDFQLNANEYKISIKQGSFKTKVLKITNTGLQDINISISAEKINDFIVFSEQSFSILPGKYKEITIDFNAPERVIPGQYFGYINVQSPKIKKSIPTVLDMQAIDLDFDLILNISEGYEIVKPGKNVMVAIDLFSLKDLRENNISMYYAIKDYTGKVYNFSEEEVILFSTLTFEKELQVPEITPEGKYLFYARASDSKNIAIDSVSFEVGTRFNLSSFLKISTLLILIIIIAILLAIFMVKYNRDKKKERLLELYIMLNKLKTLIKQKKEDEALELFIKIKKIYREPVPKEIFDDKERLKKEISELYNNFTKDAKDINKIKAALPPAVVNKIQEESKKELKEDIPKEKDKNDKK